MCKNLHILLKMEKTYQTNYYNLDMIISVGYRVNSKQGVAFRIWATKTLKDYLIKGYILNEKRLREGAAKLKDLKKDYELYAKTTSRASVKP